MPHWQTAAQRGLLGDRAKCETCMKTTSEHTRQTLGCGFAPLPAEHLLSHVRPPRPEGYVGTVRDLPGGGKTDDPTVCPGYTTSLPETIEIARARLHWKQGGPAAIGIEDWNDHPLAIGIEILEGAANAAERWSYDNPVKK